MQLKRVPSTALALTTPNIEPWRQEEWQRLWLSVESSKWGTLAVLPAATGAPPDFALMVAVTLARTGMMHLGVPIQVADATRIQLSNVAPFIDEVHHYRESGELILVALASLKDSPVSASLAAAVDSALLCVLLERMSWSEARDTVQKIGRERFVGSVVFHPSELSTLAANQR